MSEERTSELQMVQVHKSARTSDSRIRSQTLRTGVVDPSLHYRSPHQADLWWQVHSGFAPQQGSGPLAIYRQVAAATATRAGGTTIVGVGAGGGEKEALLVQRLRGSASEVDYVPVDVGLELALRSAEAGAALGAHVTPVVGDIVAMSDTDTWLNPLVAPGRRIITAYGITPNIAPSLLLPTLRNWVGPDGEVLISANLLTTWDQVLPQYDNPQTARWLWQLMVDWGIAQFLQPVRFEIGTVDGIPAVLAVTEWSADTELFIDGDVLQFSAGQRLCLFTSRRYTEELFVHTCAQWGLDVEQAFIDPSGQEGVWRARPIQ